MAWMVPIKQAGKSAMQLPQLTQKERVLDLYRRVCKDVPRIITVYDLDYTEKEVRAKARQLFEKNRSQTDPIVIERLLLLGEQEFEEITAHWKQKCHIRNILGESSRKQYTLQADLDEGLRLMQRAPAARSKSNPWLQLQKQSKA